MILVDLLPTYFPYIVSNEGIPNNIASEEDMIVANTTATHLINHRKINRSDKTVEENISISILNFDESENTANTYMEFDKSHLEEDSILPTTISFDQHENYVFNDNGNVDYEVSSAFTDHSQEEVMRASLLENRMNSPEEYEGRVVSISF